MRQYVYISTATSDLRDGDIADILQASSRNNVDREITGFLIFNGRNFLQLVEGPEESLTDLMHKLAGDARHTGIVRLVDIPIDTRVCADWTMEQIRLSNSVDQRRDDLNRILPNNLVTHIRKTILNFSSLN
ncbi:MAG: BLUF domain-containing protein [Pontixanthobacter sp.]